MTVLVSDSFNRANGALGSTDSYNGGTSLAWQTNTANFIISGNKGTVNTLDDSQFAYVETGQSNVSVSLDFSQTSTLGNCPKLFFRGIDYKNAYVIYWISTGWQLYKLTNGVPTSLSSSTIVGGPTSTNTVTVKVTGSGNSISWYLNGTLAATITDNAYAGTKHGWGTQRVQGFADNFIVEDLNTGGTGATINATLATANASSLTPTVTAQKQVSVSSVIANANADALVPTFLSNANVNITGIVATSTANAISPTVNAIKNVNVTSVFGTSNASALSPQVGSFTNITVNAVVSNANGSANIPSVTVIKNASLIVPTSNSTAIAFVPNVGLNAKVIISTIHLKGSQKLNVYLVGSQKLNVNLKGSQTLNVHLKGGIS